MYHIDLSAIVSFDWDDGNQSKNEIKHSVSNKESEEVFFNQPIFFFIDQKHSSTEQRILVYGKTNCDRHLTLIFTKRADKIRIISVRDMNKKERAKYEELKTNA
jgi:hypothetical protein